MDFDAIFQKIGRFNYHNRAAIIISVLTLTLVFSIGLINIRLQTDPENLWVSKDSLGYQQQQDFNDQYGAFYRIEQIIFGQNDGAEKNIFTHQHLYGYYFLLSLINKKSVEINDRNITVDDLCFKPIQGKGCYRPSPVDLWKMNITDINNDTDIQYTALCIDSRSETSRIPCSDQNQIPIIKQSIFGGISCNKTKDNTTDKIIPCEHCWIESKAMLATYLLNNDEYTRQSAQQWQKNVLIDSIHKFNADDGSFIQEYSKYFNVSEKGEIQFEGGFILNMNDFTSSKLGAHFIYLSQRSIPDELINETNQNFIIVIISYTAMFIYIGIAIGQVPSKTSSGFTLAVAGIVIVLASVLSSMGFITYLGVGFTMISAEVIPFLILAIGVDNMFIIKNAIESQKKQKLQDRVAYGMREVGPSITTAAICQSLAFLVGSLTKMPALQTFCVQAAVAIFFNYLLQISIFVVALIYDQQRKKANRFDVLCCIRADGEPSQPRQFWKNIFESKLTKLYMKLPFIIGCLVFALLLFALAIVGLIQMPVGLNQQVSMEVDSDLFNYFTYYKKYIEVGPLAYIVLNNFDFTNKTQIDYIEKLNNEISKLSHIQPPVYSWFASFNNFKKSDATWAEVCGSSNIDAYTYQQQLKLFLDIQITSSCCQSYGICGQQYNKDLIFNSDGKLTSSRLRFQHTPLRNSQDYIKSARQVRLAVDYVMKDLLDSDPNLSAYPYSLYYVYYDQYSYIRSVAIENFLLALAVVFLAVTIIQQIRIALVISGFVLLTTLDLVGIVFLTNWLFPDHGFVVETNAISVVNVITCVGLAVQFTAHVCISMFKLKGTQQQKLKATMRNTSSSVFIGIGLTKFVGVLVLAFAKSTLFRLYYFRMYLGIVLLGLFNGLVLLPIILYKFGPKSSEAEIEKGSLKEKLIMSDKSQ